MYSAHCVNLCGGGRWICESVEGQCGAENSVCSSTETETVASSHGSAVTWELQWSVLSSSQLRKKGHSQYPGRGTGKTAEWD